MVNPATTGVATGLKEVEEIVTRNQRAASASNEERFQEISITKKTPEFEVAKAGNHRSDGKNHGIKTKHKLLTRCSPLRLKEVILKLNDVQKAAVSEIGFGSLLDLSYNGIENDLCLWLLQRFNPYRCRLEINGVEHQLTDTDFVNVMGIRDGGEPVVFHGLAMTIEELKKKFCTDKRGSIPRSGLEKFVRHCVDGGVEFRQSFTLFVVATLLGPKSGGCIQSKWLYNIVETNRIASRNWASWSFEFLRHSVMRWKSSKKYCWGCLLFLRMFYLHNLPMAKSLVDVSRPAIAVWNRRLTRDVLRYLESSDAQEPKTFASQGRRNAHVDGDKNHHGLLLSNHDMLKRINNMVVELTKSVEKLGSSFEKSICCHKRFFEQMSQRITKCMDTFEGKIVRMRAFKERLLAITNRHLATHEHAHKEQLIAVINRHLAAQRLGIQVVDRNNMRDLGVQVIDHNMMRDFGDHSDATNTPPSEQDGISPPTDAESTECCGSNSVNMHV